MIVNQVKITAGHIDMGKKAVVKVITQLLSLQNRVFLKKHQYYKYSVKDIFILCM